MRVLLLAFAASPHQGSEPGNSWRLATGLAAAGHEVELLTSTHLMEEWRNEELPAGLVITAIPIRNAGNRLSRTPLAWYLRYNAFLRNALREARRLHATKPCDVVHHYSFGSLMWGTTLWRLGLPTVFGPAGGGSFVPPSLLEGLAPNERRVERLREALMRGVRINPRARSTLRYCFVLASNSDTARLMVKAGAREVAVTFDSPTPSSLLSRVPSTFDQRVPKQLIWVGRLIPIKAVSTAIAAMKHLPDHHLIIVGKGPLREASETLAHHLGLQAQISFTGPLNWVDTMQLIGESQVLLFTSARDTYGAQLQEAGALGTPIVAIRQHGTADHVPDTAGALVAVGTPEEVARVMAREVGALTSDRDRWSEVSVGARLYAESQSVDRQVALTVGSYSDAIEGARRRQP